jgi:bifunctional enzyme CysN/CysC
VSAVLDGKTMRLGIGKDLPHDAAGRAENLRRSAYIARYLNDAGLICCAAFTAASADARNHTISVIGEGNCIVVYLNPPLGVCQQRDPSGLYAAESNQATGNVPGVSFPYEEPTAPDLILPTHEIDIDECVDRVLNLMKERDLI